MVLGDVGNTAAALRNQQRSVPLETIEGGDVLTSIVVSLSRPESHDLTEVDLTEYKGIAATAKLYWPNLARQIPSALRFSAPSAPPPAKSSKACSVTRMM